MKESEFTNYIKTKIEQLSPEDKFKKLNYFESCIDSVRSAVAKEWTYCAGCHTYVKVSERTSETDESNRTIIRCGSCNTVHHVWSEDPHTI